MGPLPTLGGFVMLAGLVAAPYQCGRGPAPDAAIDESPGVALYRLASEFRAQGNAAAWRGTLTNLVKNYPGTREAVMASDELATTPDGALPATAEK